MPTHSLLPFVESPDGLAQDILISNNASIPGPVSSMTPHNNYSDKAVLHSGGVSLSCMFCDQAFSHQDELGPHVLTDHPATFYEPAVLRVEAEFRIPGERPKPKPCSLPIEKYDVHSCIVCGQVSQDISELEAHMRKHKDYFTYCCNVCGRRFREPWFLKNHMKMHVKSGTKNKAQQDLETPVTINGITQEYASQPAVTVYKMCMVCGFFFPNYDSLAEHSKAHNREVELGKDEDKENMDAISESTNEQETFLQCINLVPCSAINNLQQERSSKWIPQLDPLNTYQAWQLATKGKIAVGLSNTKDINQEASTDNEDCNSDKEEFNNNCSQGQDDKVAKEIVRKEPQSQQQTVVENPKLQRRSLMQKDNDKERPTTCEECQRTFRTYHQLVLHSRVHKRERGGEESPTSADGKLSRAGSMEHAEEGSEEGFDETALTENLGTGEDGSDRSKGRSKECSFCGKSFRSSYYLTVHLRTHTGEKPYKCAYCDYAAAQKTSLKYHIDRRHKDKPYVEIPSKPVPSIPSPNNGKQEHYSENPTPKTSTLWISGVSSCTTATPEDSEDGKSGKPLIQMYEKIITMSSSPTAVLTKCSTPANLKMERQDIKENSEGPLNLSSKVSLPIGADAGNALIPIGCSYCQYKTMYPEVLIIHKKLSHKDKCTTTKKNSFECSLKQKRYTGCPPALEGKDVTPLSVTDRRHPRRTKSPPPQPAKPQDKISVNPLQGPKRSPVHCPPHNVVKETQSNRQKAELQPRQEPSRYTEVIRKPHTGSKYVMDRSGLPDRLGIGERSYPVRSGVIWHSDAARLCLSSRFGSLPQMAFGEPSSKRFKYMVPTGREAETSEKPGFREPAKDGVSRLIMSGKSVKTTAQGPGLSPVSESLGPGKNTTAIGGLDTDWSMMNLLHSYTPNDLVSLYHNTSTNPSHGGLTNPRAGCRTVLYQPLPSLPSLPRRDPSAFSNHCYRSADKST